MWTVLYRKNDNYGPVIQIADFKPLCGFEVRTPMIVGLKIVVVIIIALVLIFIRSLFCPRYCSKYFISINLFNFQNNPLEYIL